MVVIKIYIVAALGITLEKYPTLKNADGMKFCSTYHSSFKDNIVQSTLLLSQSDKYCYIPTPMKRSTQTSVKENYSN